MRTSPTAADRPILRWLLTILSAWSLIACPWSCWWWLSVAMHSDDIVGISQGCVGAGIVYDKPWADRIRPASIIFGAAPDYMPLLPFGSVESSDIWFSVTVPLWAIALASGVPAAWLWAKRRRLRPTDCRKCGYDLSATPRNTKCPECGQIVKQSTERPRA